MAKRKREDSTDSVDTEECPSEGEGCGPISLDADGDMIVSRPPTKKSAPIQNWENGTNPFFSSTSTTKSHIKHSSKEKSDGKSCKSKRRRVSFDGVTMFYFARSQGFGCVPTVGGTTLGMSPTHQAVRRLSLGEHEEEVENQHNSVNLDQRLMASNGNGGVDEDYDETEENEGTDLFENSTAVVEQTTTTGEHSSTSDETTPFNNEQEKEEEFFPQAGFLELKNSTAAQETLPLFQARKYRERVFQFEKFKSPPAPYRTLVQPLMVRERRALLKSAGVRIEKTERAECQSIRQSRQSCGCDCGPLCQPDTCNCARAQIQCQVDRDGFPCACSSQDCANPWGRVEFDALKVRSHYFNTMMRMKHMNEEHRASPNHVLFPPDDQETIPPLSTVFDPVDDGFQGTSC